MKKIIFLSSLCLLCFQMFAQTKKKATPRGPGTSQQAPATLANLTDSLSYSIGIMVANFYKQQGISKINNKHGSKSHSG